MAKIKHIAVSTQDPEATAKFYVDVFGLKQIGRVDSMGASGNYLTDGDINVAIMKFKTDAEAVYTPSGTRVPFGAITGIGKKNWDSKGIAKVRYTVDGSTPTLMKIA